MRRLKEQVKRGERSATDALKELEAAARKNGSMLYLRTTPTWRWLRARRKEDVIAKSS